MLKRFYWVAYAVYLIRRGWDRAQAVNHVRRLYRYERRRQLRLAGRDDEGSLMHSREPR